MKIKYHKPHDQFPKEMIALGYNPNVELHLDEKAIYIVYGISIWKDILHYLIIPTDEMLPSWIPAMLFEIVDQRLPFEWYFRYFGECHPTDMKIELGYKELVCNDNHSVNLLERDKKEIRIFLDRKKEIDEDS